MSGAASERTSTSDELRGDDFSKAAAVARRLDHPDAMADLTYNVLCAQADARQPTSSKRLVGDRAKAYGLTRKRATTPHGNLMSILQHGADSKQQRVLLGVLFANGLARELDSASDQRREQLLDRFVERGDWIALATPIQLQPALEQALSTAQYRLLCQAIRRAVLRDDAQDSDSVTRARNALRLSALSPRDDDKREAVREVLEAIAAEAKDPCSRAGARALLGEPERVSQQGAVEPSEHESLRPGESLELSGRLGRFPPGPYWALLRWLSGWALLSWCARFVLYTLGVRTEARVLLSDRTLMVERSTRLLGRVIRAEHAVYSLQSLRLARRSTRFPSLHLLAGVVCFALGTLVGGVFLFDGVRLGELPLLGIAGAALLAGAGLDLLLDVAIPGGRGTVALDLDLGKGARTRLSRVPQAQADPFLNVLADSLGQA